ncbi:hypothetical protein [Vibrio sp. EA2]|uniref:hypothetical protein n=1 Tax=Vibrio sp. EA2 TaxID=3079860 RepID=UPI00294A7E72|nr:hypothetical protein [Vibrio sp. EA2]MDV6254300.1 hypothetical protein [Vibrio sp. EA2]
MSAPEYVKRNEKIGHNSLKAPQGVQSISILKPHKYDIFEFKSPEPPKIINIAGKRLVVTKTKKELVIRAIKLRIAV